MLLRLRYVDTTALRLSELGLCPERKNEKKTMTEGGEESKDFLAIQESSDNYYYLRQHYMPRGGEYTEAVLRVGDI